MKLLFWFRGTTKNITVTTKHYVTPTQGTFFCLDSDQALFTVSFLYGEIAMRQESPNFELFAECWNCFFLLFKLEGCVVSYIHVGGRS